MRLKLNNALPGGVEEMLRLPQVVRATGLTKSQIYLNVAAGTFPKPVKVSLRASAWPASEIRAWQQARIAEREAA